MFYNNLGIQPDVCKNDHPARLNVQRFFIDKLWELSVLPLFHYNEDGKISAINGGRNMLFIDNKGITDPQINLAIEEYAEKLICNYDKDLAEKILETAKALHE